MLFVVLCVVCRSLCDVRCSLRVVSWLVHAGWCLLFVACWFGLCCMLFAVRRALCVVRSMVFVV